MAVSVNKNRLRWALALSGAVVVLAGVGRLFHPPLPTALPTTKPPKPASVGMTGPGSAGNELLQEQAQLQDPTPLFLPTEFNAAQDTLPDKVLHKPGEQFAGFLPKLSYGEADLKLGFAPTVSVPKGATEALLSQPTQQPFPGFGRLDSPGGELPSRGAMLEVIFAKTGQTVWEKVLAEARPPGDKTWQPLEFLVAVDAAGLVGPPLLSVRSGVEEVDGYFQNYLVKTLHVGARLSPGFYRICVGP